MKTPRFLFIMMIAAAVAFISCDPSSKGEEPVNNEEPNKEEPNKEEPETKISDEIKQADQFSIDMLETYYLWTKEVAKDLSKLDPSSCEDPVSTVKEIRYHENNKEVDHWTSLTKKLDDMTSSVQGLGLSYGYDLQAYWADNTQTNIVLVVNYVAKDGPAEKAGVKRGDLIWKLDGNMITISNYADAYNSEAITLGIGSDSSHTTSVSIAAKDMWEDPVLLDTTYVVGDKTVGYLVYNSFDLKSSETLPDVFRRFKEKGIEELILDLRYNGGGYTFTECELASMIAPPANVAAGDVFQTEVYNSILTEAWKAQGYDSNTYFKTRHVMSSQNIDQDVSDANPGISKLYVIVTGGSASASEGLIVGLGPYMDITLVGQQTYGKYCAGYMLSPSDLYGSSSKVDYSLIKDWGMYVMVSKFADKNGKNDAMPDGIPVDIEVRDNPMDGYQIGDEEETMLRAALAAAGKAETKASVGRNLPSYVPVVGFEGPRPKGILVKTELPEIFE